MGLLLNPRAAFALASEFQQKGAAVGALFEFASGLYFRGKLAYARAFGRGPRGGSGGLAIVPGRGLMDVEQRITAEELRAIGEVPVDVRDARYREALVRDAELLASRLGKRGEAVQERGAGLSIFAICQSDRAHVRTAHGSARRCARGG